MSPSIAGSCVHSYYVGLYNIRFDQFQSNHSPPGHRVARSTTTTTTTQKKGFVCRHPQKKKHIRPHPTSMADVSLKITRLINISRVFFFFYMCVSLMSFSSRPYAQVIIGFGCYFIFYAKHIRHNTQSITTQKPSIIMFLLCNKTSQLSPFFFLSLKGLKYLE